MEEGRFATLMESSTKASGKILFTRLQDKKHGNGQYYFKEGKRYDGEFHLNEMHGSGTIYAKNGSIFKGITSSKPRELQDGQKGRKGLSKRPERHAF